MAPDHRVVRVPRALRVVRDTEDLGALVSAKSAASDVPPYVREATSLIQAIQAASASKGKVSSLMAANLGKNPKIWLAMTKP